MGVLAWMDRMETVNEICLKRLTDATAAVSQPQEARALAARDGFLFIRGLIPHEKVRALRNLILVYANRAGWLDPSKRIVDGHGMPGKRIGDYEAAEWLELQARVQTSREFWEVGDCVEIHRALHAATGRSSFLYNSMNTCRVVSAHPDMVALPHQDAHYVRAAEEFWTAWVPIGDCPSELGGLAVLPGSHHLGLREHWGQGILVGGTHVPDDAVWQTENFQCGDALLLTRHAIHKSLPNVTGIRLRISADFRYGFWPE
jgi:hypothetical protein